MNTEAELVRIVLTAKDRYIAALEFRIDALTAELDEQRAAHDIAIQLINGQTLVIERLQS